MKFLLAAAALLVGAATASNPFAPKSANNAESNYVNNLMRGARPTANSQIRKLDQNNQEQAEIDISGYAVKFEQCQFVKTYDDELAEDEESETVLATKRFVVFRLCPNSNCGSCNYGYGEYIIELEEYLEATVEYQQELQQEMCNACNECQNNQNQDGQQDNGDGQNDNQNRRLQDVDCDSCYDECYKIENMEANGYMDATEFLGCELIYDAQDDNGEALYAGPICASNGARIKIGVFQDENCYVADSSKNVEDYLMDGDGYPMKLSHALLKTTYSEDSCVSCLVVEEEDENADQNQDGNQEEQEPETVEMCRQLYEAAAKCESPYGFDTGIDNYQMYDNQISQEETVCDFIDSIKAKSYDEDGNIYLKGESFSVGGESKTSGGQKFTLTFFILGTVGLAVYAAILHSKLTKSGGAELSNQGGAMA